MNDKIQLKRGTLANWLKADPVLMDGEMALVATDASKPTVYDQYKVGGGSKKFSELPYQGLPCLQELGDSTTSPLSQKAITDWINKGYQFRGIAIPSTNPGTPDGPVFYIATEAGTYANFNSISVADGEAVILLWNDGSWTKKTTGLATEQEIIYDVSARNGRVVFESLQALLSSSNLSTLIPTSVRHGGMSIRFIQGSGSDNKYVQYRLMNQNWSTVVTDWQGVDDEPTARSNNLVKSGGVRKELDSKFFTFINQDTSVRKALDGILELYIKLPDSYIGDTIQLARIDRNYGSSGTVLVFFDVTKSQHIYNLSPLDEDKNIISIKTYSNVEVYAVVDWSKFPNNMQTTYSVDLSDAVYDVRNSPYIMAYLDDIANRESIDNDYKDVFTTKAEVEILNEEVEDVRELTSDNYHEITEIKSKMAVETQEPGAYFTDENGNAFMQYDENGFDVEKISESFKEKLEDDIYSDEGIKKTSEDGVSVVTDAFGNSSVYWDNSNGLDTNKVGYNLAQAVKEKYVKNMKEWSNLGIGMLIHWGIYSVLAGHYQGVNIDGQTEDYYSTGIAEWILKLARIPKETYQAYQSQFTASNWDADAVAKMAYDCGMKYIVITVKHHDGFVLYNSDYAPWNLSTSGAGGKDPLMELKNACEKYGLKFCTYFSHQKDWTAEGGWDQGWTNGGVDPYTEAQHKAYIKNTINVLKEFIKKYDPYILWYDGDSVAPYNSDLYDEQKNYYPQVITNNRLFNTPQKANYACGEGNYFRGSMEQWKYAENCYSTNGSWGYNEKYDIPEKTISLYDLICKQILESKARSQNSLINIGPKGDGAISDLTKTLFRELSDYVVKYGTFDNTRGLNYYTFPNWGRAIIKGRTLRCYVWGGNTSILVDGVYTKYIKSVHVWDIQNPESQDNYQVISDYRLQISNIPVNNDYPSLVDVEFGNDIIFEDYSNIIDDTHYVIDASAFQSNSGCSLLLFSSVPQFGGWIGSGNVSSIFLYNGTSGNHNVKLYIPMQQSGDVTITIKVKDIETDSETTLTVTNSSTTTSETVMLTNGHKYRIEVSKTASVWINLSKVEFINQL